jgi:CRP-like cAMP-binding protein
MSRREALSSTPRFLAGLTSDQQKHVIQSAEVRTFPKESVVITTGDAANRLFLLKKGKVKYYRVTSKGHQVLLWWVVPGDIFGMGSLLASPVRYIGTAETIDDCEVLVWSRKKIRQFAETNKRLSENTLHILMQYLSAYADRVIGLISDTAEQRLARALLHLGGGLGGQMRSGGLELAITNELLGGLADVSIFETSRHLKKWERQGVLRKSRGKITILSPEGLVID